MIQPGKQVNWHSLVSEQQTSGQSVAAFCRTREVSEGLFYYWRKRLRAAEAPEFDASHLRALLAVVESES